VPGPTTHRNRSTAQTAAPRAAVQTSARARWLPSPRALSSPVSRDLGRTSPLPHFAAVAVPVTPQCPKTGCVDEFVLCAETLQPLLAEEAERCDVTHRLVVPGLLVRCEVSGNKVLPSLLEKSAATGKVALKQLFVSSIISGVRLLEEESIASATGKHCIQKEGKLCVWSGKKCHPDDLRTCRLTYVTAHFEFMTTNGEIRLEPLLNPLNRLRKELARPKNPANRFAMRHSRS
jgi:hypothetical protein